MRQISRSTFASFAVGMAAIAALSGCASQGDEPPLTWTAPESTHRNEVVPAHAGTELRFAPGHAGSLSPDQAQRLDAFLSANLVSPSAHITLRERGGRGIAAPVRAHLIANGLRPQNVTIVPAPQASRSLTQSVGVEVQQYLVRVPECGDWSKPPSLLDDTHVHSNFGCADQRNLGLMVANPQDLVVGQGGDRVDAQPQVGAMERYRTDKVTPLPETQGFK